jgi:hypothetical protein
VYLLPAPAVANLAYHFAFDYVREQMDVARSAGFDATEDSIAERLEPLCADGLMLRDGRRYLALAVGLGAYKPTRTARRASRNTMAREQIDAAAVQELLVSVSRGSRSFIDRRV